MRTLDLGVDHLKPVGFIEVIESDLYGECINPDTPNYCYEVAEWMLAARRNMKQTT